LLQGGSVSILTEKVVNKPGVAHMTDRCVATIAWISFLALMMLAAVASSFAKVIHVPGDQPKIQYAINSSSNGDTVLVAPGRYSENINFQGKAITVTSSGGSSVTILDGGRQGAVVTFDYQETAASVIGGFTIQNGSAAGIAVSASSPTIVNNIISNNQSGISVSNGSPTITGNVISYNLTPNGTSGIDVEFASPLIRNNLITSNAGLAVFIGGAGACQLTGNIISNNSGGGIELWSPGAALVANNVITGNSNPYNGGGIEMYSDVSKTVIVQNLIAGNVSPNGNAIYWSNPPGLLVDNTITDSPLSRGGSTISADGFWGAPGIVNNIIVADGGATYAFSCNQQDFPLGAVSYNDVFSTNGHPYGGMCTDQTAGNGNISADPKFVSNGFSLQSGSPAIDVGNNSGLSLPDADILNNPRIVNGSGGASAVVDMGAYEYIPTPLFFVSVTPCRVVDTRNPDGPFGGPPIQGGTERDFAIPQGGCNIPATAIAYALNVTAVPGGPLGYLTMWPTGPTQPVASTLNSVDGRVKANAALTEAGNYGSVSVFASNKTDVVIDINGYFAFSGSQTYQFYPLAPCRVIDTRNAKGDLGGPYLSGQVPRDFPVLESACFPKGLTPAAYSFNFTVVPHVPLGYLTVWPADQQQPVVSTLNAVTGTVVANAALVMASKADGDIKVFASNDTDLVVDVNGYFAAPAGQNGLSLYPVPPCRVLDTRNGNGAFSGTLSPPVDVVGSICAPSSTAQAYVFNATVVPSGPLGYLTLWPDDGSPLPAVATLNAVDGAVTSNMAIVPTTNGKIDAYASHLTQLILDISSYFAP
jgi:parallel beta-helix repeat protein